MRVLVICGFYQSGVATVRALARAGHHVDAAVTLSPGRPHFQRWFVSRYAHRRVVVPHPRENPEAFQESVLALCRDGRYDVVLPTGEESTLVLSAIQSMLEPYTKSPLADAEQISLVHDKARLHQTLYAAGFNVPRPYEYRNHDDLMHMDIEFPVVVKARKNSGAQRGIRYARDREVMLAAVREIEGQASPHPTISDFFKPLIQEYIPGTVHDADCLYCHGEPRAAMTSHRKIMYPSSGGGSVIAVTTHEPELLAYAESILRYLNWHGLCDLEVMKDSRDGKYKLLEINPRIWGLLDLSIKAGIDFPTKACEIAVYGDTQPVFDYRVDLQYSMLFPRTFLSLAESKALRWNRFKETLRVLGPHGRCELGFRDPLPHIFDMLNTVRLFVDKMRGKPI